MTVPTKPSSAARFLTIVIASLLLLAVALRLAWLGDDAYITLRSVENWVTGNGMRWNSDERVQTFTHPLWMLLLSLGRLLSGEVYFTTLWLSVSVSMVAIVFLLWRAATLPAIVAITALLLAARAFGDYMTSGLETPLTYLLLIVFVAVVRAPADEPKQASRRYTWAVLLTALLATNRMDLGLLCIVPVLATMRGVPLQMVIVRGAFASLPLLCWLLFASIYYGSPFPVTAHAKAFSVGIPAMELAEQGVRYLWHSVVHDPALIATVAVGGLALLTAKRLRWLAAGSLLYVIYIVKVGGDFMEGRFLLPSFVVVVACLDEWLQRHRWRVAAPVAIVALSLSFATGLPAWLTAPSQDAPPSDAMVEAQHGIIDERKAYYRDHGLFATQRKLPRFGSLTEQVFSEGRQQPWWLLHSLAGSVGFNAGSLGHIVDQLLCDPLLARLPARDPRFWRIGHISRRIPEGYWESLRSDDNRIHHPGLRRYYEALRTLTRSPVWSSDRLAVLSNMAMGHYNEDLRSFVAEQYYDPPRIEVAAADLAPELQLGEYWFDDQRIRILYEGGLAVRLDGPSSARSLRLQVLGFGTFRCRFVRDGKVCGEATGVPLPLQHKISGLRLAVGLRSEQVAVPAAVTAFDTVWIDFVMPPGPSSAPGPPGLGAMTFGN